MGGERHGGCDGAINGKSAEARLAADARAGRTWRVGQDGERFSRTWGEVLSPDGSVRKFGNSTTGESWDTTVVENVYFDKSKPPTWQEVLSSERTLDVHRIDACDAKTRTTTTTLSGRSRETRRN